MRYFWKNLKITGSKIEETEIERSICMRLAPFTKDFNAGASPRAQLPRSKKARQHPENMSKISEKTKKRKASAGKQKVNEDNATAHITLGLNLSCCACVHEEHDCETKRDGNWIKSPRDNSLIDGVGLIWKTVRTSEKFLTSPQFAAREQQLKKKRKRNTRMFRSRRE